MIHPIALLAQEITEGAKADPPFLKAKNDQIHTELRETFQAHGIETTGALGCVVINVVQKVLGLIVQEGLENGVCALEKVVEVMGAVAEYGASLVEKDQPMQFDGRTRIVPAYASHFSSGPQGQRS